jgi:hypothetical protein
MVPADPKTQTSERPGGSAIDRPARAASLLDLRLDRRRAVPVTPPAPVARNAPIPAEPAPAVDAAGPAAEPSSPTPTPPRPAAERIERRPADIVGYWNQLKEGRRLPSWSALDSALIAERWPNSLLLTCDGDSDRLKLESMFTQALRTANPNGGGAATGIQFTPMLTDWVLSLGREASQRGTPIVDTEAFPSLAGDDRYRAVALPLSDDGTDVDHVLCHLARA